MIGISTEYVDKADFPWGKALGSHQVHSFFLPSPRNMANQIALALISVIEVVISKAFQMPPDIVQKNEYQNVMNLTPIHAVFRIDMSDPNR